MKWIDCHNHLQFSDLGTPGQAVVDLHGSEVERGVVNATHERDWEAVEALAQAYPNAVWPAFGIHPWHAHEGCGGRHASPWQERLCGLLEKFPQASVGECGLDRCVSTPGLEMQGPVFLEHLRIAREWQRPMTIHCVKAWGPLFDAFAVEAPPPRFLMHAFSGSLETARRLLPLGAYFSLSGAFLHPRKAAMLDTFRRVPQDRILLETDAPESLPPPEYVSHPLPDHRNHPANLPAIARGLAKALGMSAAEFSDLTCNNARACFGC